MSVTRIEMEDSLDDVLDSLPYGVRLEKRKNGYTAILNNRLVGYTYNLVRGDTAKEALEGLLACLESEHPDAVRLAADN